MKNLIALFSLCLPLSVFAQGTPLRSLEVPPGTIDGQVLTYYGPANTWYPKTASGGVGGTGISTNFGSGLSNYFAYPTSSNAAFVGTTVLGAVTATTAVLTSVVGLGDGLTNSSGYNFADTNLLTTDTNTLAGYARLMTNRAALYVDGSNVLAASLTFASASNVLALPCKYQLLVSATPTAITNVTYPTAGYFWEGQVCISNSTAAGFTNYMIVSGLVPSGYGATNASATLGLNAFVVPASKQVDVWVECRAGQDTNYSVRYR